MIDIASPQLGEEEKERVLDVLDSGHLVSGKYVEQLEGGFSDYVGTEEAVATSSGTSALQTALTAVGVGEGDRVVTTSFSFVATANAILSVGAEPVFADVRPDTYNLDSDAVEEALRSTDDVAAVLAVHLYGQTADMAALSDLAEDHDVRVVEDACQAHGAEHDGRRAGALGDVGCFSFYPSKNMTTGEGGVVTTDDEGVADRARSFIDHGRTEGYSHDSFGMNLRMTDLQAAIGTAQLKRLEEFNERRRKNAGLLREGLDGVEDIVLPAEAANRRHAYNQFTIRAERRDDLQRFLKERGIDSRVYYPIPIYRQPFYQGRAEYVGLPEAEKAAAEVLSLPVHPGLNAEEVSSVVESVRRFYERG